MNYKVIIYLFCLLFIFSCKKDHQSQQDQTPAPAPKLYHVKFNVSGFDQTQVAIDGASLKTEGLKTSAVDSIPVNQLFMVITDAYSNGYNPPYFSIKSQLKGSSGFGVFDGDLPANGYDIYFCGGDTNLLYQPSNGYPYFGYATYWRETYYKHILLLLQKDTVVNQNIVLSRATGQLELNVQDAIPSNVTSIRLSYTDRVGLSAYYYSNSSASKPIVYTRTIAASDIGKTNYKIDIATMNVDNTPFNVTIDYFTTASSTTPAVTKIVPNVTCQANKRTILSGNLFTPNTTAFNVSIDQTWNPTQTVNF